MKVEDLPEKVAQGVDEARDRAAGALSGEGDSVFRAMGRVSDRVEQAEKSLQERISDAEATLGAAVAAMSFSKRTTWPRRMFWLLLGAAAVAGFVAANPDKAKELRQKLMS